MIKTMYGDGCLLEAKTDRDRADTGVNTDWDCLLVGCCFRICFE